MEQLYNVIQYSCMLFVSLFKRTYCFYINKNSNATKLKIVILDYCWNYIINIFVFSFNISSSYIYYVKYKTMIFIDSIEINFELLKTFIILKYLYIIAIHNEINVQVELWKISSDLKFLNIPLETLAKVKINVNVKDSRESSSHKQQIKSRVL